MCPKEAMHFDAQLGVAVAGVFHEGTTLVRRKVERGVEHRVGTAEALRGRERHAPQATTSG